MKFNRLSLLPVGMAAAVAAAMFTTGCGSRTGAEKFTTDSITYDDSVVVGQSRAYCTMAVAYPATGSQPLIDSVGQWIARQLAESPNITSGSEKSPDYTAITDGAELLRTAGTYLMAESKEDLEEYQRDSITINFEFNWNIRPVCDSTRFVTYASSTYCYLGGAHGGAGYTPATFDKVSGQCFGWNMIVPDSVAALRNMIKNRLLTDFFNVDSYDGIRDGLFVDPDTMPLPVTPPCFVTDGVDFTYMQYEIAPYAAGMPSCVIDYATIRPLLTPQARALLD